MKTGKYIIISALLLLVYSCKKTKLDNELGILVGEWEWQYTVNKSNCDNPITNQITASPSLNGFDYSMTFFKKGKLELKKTGDKAKKYRIVRYHTAAINKDSVFAFYLNNKEDDDFTVELHKTGEQLYLHTNYFPKGIVDGYDGCHVTYSLFKKK